MKGRLVEQTRMRQRIAHLMSESKRTVPHFYVQAEVSVDSLLDAIDRLNAEDRAAKITMTAGLVAACIHTLREHPEANSVWTEEGLLRAEDVNVGVAVALDDGLLAPALLGVDGLGLPELAQALRELVERARAGRLRVPELTQGTFTLSNLGMFAVSAFAAIVTPPQVAVLATARPCERWIVEDGKAVVRKVMTVTLSADHRALDGADAARFLETFGATVQDPAALVGDAVQREEAIS